MIIDTGQQKFLLPDNPSRGCSVLIEEELGTDYILDEFEQCYDGSFVLRLLTPRKGWMRIFGYKRVSYHF